MDLYPFKQDIDELIHEFVQSKSSTLNDMKRIWSSMKFSYIYEASPSTNLAFFMQSLYAHTIGHMINVDSLTCRLGGLYCLYETQPLKPPFKIYLSLGEMKKLTSLVAEAKEMGITVVTTLVKRMLEKDMFLFGFVDLNESSVNEMINSLTKIQDARIQVAYEKLFTDTDIERCIHMDLSVEVDFDKIKKMSTEYAAAKRKAIEEVGEVVDIQNIKQITDYEKPLSEIVEKIDESWSNQREVFYRRTGLNLQKPAEEEQPQLLQLQLKENEAGNDDDDEFFRLLYEHD